MLLLKGKKMGAEGIEPPSPGLEPGIIPVYYAPLRKLRNISFNAFLLNFYTLFHIYKNEQKTKY